MTIGGLAASAPIDASRTAFGQASQYMLVPVGLAMAWLAKQIADSGIQESKRFLPTMTAVLVFIYFLLVKLLYRADPAAVYDMTSRRPRARMAGPMAEIRQGAGDRALLEAGSEADPRAYRPRRAGDGKALMDDLAWYEGRYPDAAAVAGAGAGPGAAGERAQPRANLRSFLSPPDEKW